MGTAGQGRTIFAGFGAAGSLLAAIGATFVVAGGVLGFQQWPSELVQPPDKDLSVAAAAVQRIPVALPASRASRPARLATGSRTAGAIRPAGPRSAGGGSGTAPSGGPSRAPSDTAAQPGSQADRPVVPVTPPALPLTGTVIPPVDQAAVVTGVESTSSATAKTLQSVGEAVPVAQPVTDLLGGVVDGAGRAVGGLLRGLGS